MTWAAPNADAVTLGEMDGELLSVSPRDESHVGDAFTRRGGAVFPPARVASSKPRRPFGQQASLTRERSDSDAVDAGAVRLARQAAGAARAFLFDDEQQVLRAVTEHVRAAAAKLLAGVTGGAGADESDGERGDGAEFAATAEANERSALGRRFSTGSGRLPLSRSDESIAAMSWHPTLSVLAVAQRDGAVAFYDVGSAAWDARTLAHDAQSEITGMEWAKFSGGVLAVACRGGVFLWKLNCKSANEAPVLLKILTHPTKTSFHHVSWSADGSLLAAFAKHSSTICVFDTVFDRRTELQSPHKVVGLHWSPTGEYLFVATEYVAMWETLTWKKETWDLAAGCLLIALRNQSTLYPYSFPGTPPLIDAQISSPAIEFPEREVPSFDQRISELVGGKVQRIAWDPTGTRIAVTYRTGAVDLPGPLVVIFTVAWQPFLIFTRSGLLRGPPNAGVPREVAFASSFDGGALLGVAWSKGLVTFHPFYLQAQP
ncbi:hypothetical protein PybrP1_007382 [[Pythium] brassicae (nom. inval.)]|nr:hypothetical protein PybrP1_007382 [[Pythium] brassicae (nom. inval.)]